MLHLWLPFWNLLTATCIFLDIQILVVFFRFPSSWFSVRRLHQFSSKLEILLIPSFSSMSCGWSVNFALNSTARCSCTLITRKLDTFIPRLFYIVSHVAGKCKNRNMDVFGDIEVKSILCRSGWLILLAIVHNILSSFYPLINWRRGIWWNWVRAASHNNIHKRENS